MRKAASGGPATHENENTARVRITSRTPEPEDRWCGKQSDADTGRPAERHKSENGRGSEVDRARAVVSATVNAPHQSMNEVLTRAVGAGRHHQCGDEATDVVGGQGQPHLARGRVVQRDENDADCWVQEGELQPPQQGGRRNQQTHGWQPVRHHLLAAWASPPSAAHSPRRA